MEVTTFIQVIAAVIIGNLVSFGFAYFVWRTTKQEKLTGSHEGLPFWVYLLGVMPGAIVAFGGYLMPH